MNAITKLNTAIQLIAANNGLIDSHNNNEVVKIKSGALALINYAPETGRDPSVVALFDTGAHSLNYVLFDEKGQALLSTIATVVCDVQVDFDNYEEVFNRDIGPHCYMGQGCSISNVTPFEVE